jgi:hypothetical protein
MKKYFLFALALMVFAIAPIMADATVSGAYRYGGIWDFSEEEYDGGISRYRLVFKSKIDDFNYFESRASGTGSPIKTDYLYLKTDWGKYFGFADMGFGLTSTIGQNEVFDTNGVIGFTIYDVGAGGLEITGTPAMKLNMDVMGIVKPYFVTSMEAFDATQGVDKVAYLLGANIDFAPVAAEVYFGQVGVDKAGKLFGVDALFSSEVADGIDLSVGGAFEMESDAADEWAWGYVFGVGVGAYGAQVDVAIGGAKDDEFQSLDASVKYDILSWMGVQAGMRMAFGDKKEFLHNDEGFLGAEFGVYVKPGKSTYGLGYIIANKDAFATVGGDDYGYGAHDGPIGGFMTKSGGL